MCDAELALCETMCRRRVKRCVGTEFLLILHTLCVKMSAFTHLFSHKTAQSQRHTLGKLFHEYVLVQSTDLSINFHKGILL